MAAFKELAQKFFSGVSDFGTQQVAASLRDNYSQYGERLGVHNVEEYEAMARKFFQENIESADPLCSRVELPHGRIGIDYNGEYRGIYDEDGNPLAFFPPNFRALGYTSKDEELADWRTGANYQ